MPTSHTSAQREVGDEDRDHDLATSRLGRYHERYPGWHTVLGTVATFRILPRFATSAASDLRVVCNLIEIDAGARISLRKKWSYGLRLMAEEWPGHFAHLVGGKADATTGDVLIQLAAFGQVRYG